MRIKVLEELMKGAKCVTDFEEFLEISQPNVSQHLTLRRRYQIIDYYIDGRLRCYFLRNPIPDLVGVIKKGYEEELPAPACCPVPGRANIPVTGGIDERRKKEDTM